MAKATSTFEFFIEVSGAKYKCQQIVTGTRELTQEVRVLGVGSESDHHRYGPKRRPVSTMEGVAKQIAREIVLKHVQSTEEE